MLDPAPAVPDPTIVNTPPPAAPLAPEAVIYPETPAAPVPAVPPSGTPPAPGAPAAAKPPEAPATPPATPSEPPKPPTEPAKPGAPTAPAPAPTEFDLKLSPDSPLTAEDVAQTAKDAKAAGLTQAQAEALLTTKDQGARALQTRQQQAFEQTKVAWKEAVAKDPEMGGDKLAETVALSSRAFKELASAELQIWADKTGLGSYPEFVRMMAKVGRMMGEDKLVRGTVGAPDTKRSREEVLYGKTTPGADGKVPVAAS